MKRIALAICLLLLPALSSAQAARLKLPTFDHLTKIATESVDISLDGALLQTAGRFAGAAAGPTEPALGDALKGLQGIYIRSFKFDHPNAYSQGDVEGIRQQLNGSGWKKLISVHEAAKGEHVDIAMRSDPKDGGLVIVASEPLELTIVNIVGAVDLETLRQLQGKLGVPKMGPVAGPAGQAPSAAAPAAPDNK
jgi:hypothetical protein